MDLWTDVPPIEPAIIFDILICLPCFSRSAFSRPMLAPHSDNVLPEVPILLLKTRRHFLPVAWRDSRPRIEKMCCWFFGEAGFAINKSCSQSVWQGCSVLIVQGIYQIASPFELCDQIRVPDGTKMECRSLHISVSLVMIASIQDVTNAIDTWNTLARKPIKNIW